MKNFLVLLAALLCLGTEVFAQTSLNAYPFFPEVDKRFRKLEQKQVSKFIWDFNQQGGANGTNISLRPYYGNQTLPPNAVVTRSYFITKNALNSGVVGELISVGCSGNSTLFLSSGASTALATAGNFLDGTSTGASTAFKSVGTSSCQPVINFGGAPTSGYISAWLEYVVP